MFLVSDNIQQKNPVSGKIDACANSGYQALLSPEGPGYEANLLQDRGVDLNIPSMKIGPQLSCDDMILTRRIANLRIHVERE